MARLSREQLREKLKEQRPGYRIVEQKASAEPARERGAAPDAVSPDLEHPQRQNRSHGDAAGDLEGFGHDRTLGDDTDDIDDDDMEDDGSTALLIAPEDATDDDLSAGPKIVIMDPQGNIRSQQG